MEIIFKAKNPVLVEEGIRAEILMLNSNLISYTRREDEFVLFFDGEPDVSVIKELKNLETFS